MGHSDYAISAIWFTFGFVLATCWFNARIKQSILRLGQALYGRTQASFRHAVPEAADKGLAAGWAAAGGAFVSLVLQNIGAFLSANDPWLQFYSLILTSLAVVTLTLYLYSVHKHQVVLANTWPFVVWSHYRPLLTKVAAAVRPHGYLDFVTHQGSDLNNHLLDTGPVEMRYGPCKVGETVVLICDVEAMEEIAQAPLIKDRATNVALEGLGAPDRFSIHTELAKLLRINVDQPTQFIPMRWGFNALAIKCDDPKVVNTLREQFLGRDFAGIDLFDFITNRDNETRRLLRVDDLDCPMITFEWFLPPMMLLVSAACGSGAWMRQDQRENPRIETLVEAAADWLCGSAGGPRPVKPIIRNIVEMQDVLASHNRCVVLAGGNFLWNRDTGNKELSPDNLVFIPVNFNSKNAPSCLIWCEVLAIYSAVANKNNVSWRSEAKSLISLVSSRLAGSMSSMPFHGYSPYPTQQSGSDTICDQWRDFALANGVVRYGDTGMDHYWRDRWAKACERIQAPIHLPEVAKHERSTS